MTGESTVGQNRLAGPTRMCLEIVRSINADMVHDALDSKRICNLDCSAGFIGR
jgi:hypothetical protein